jgi:hypothetical protein
MVTHTEQAHYLAQRCLNACRTLVTVLERCTDEQWQAKPTGDDRTLGVIMHHVAGSYTALIDLITAVLNEQPTPYMFQDDLALHQWNHEYAEQHKECAKTETIALLQHNSTLASQFIRGLSDEQFQKVTCDPLMVLWFGPQPTVAQIIEGTLVTHPDRHLPDIDAVCTR